jgi:hypothetical protein
LEGTPANMCAAGLIAGYDHCGTQTLYTVDVLPCSAKRYLPLMVGPYQDRNLSCRAFSSQHDLVLTQFTFTFTGLRCVNAASLVAVTRTDGDSRRRDTNADPNSITEP